MEILQIENLSFRYPKAEHNALTDVTLSINRGELVVVCGQSGCGKTTLLRLLKKELAPAGEQVGSVRYCGTPVGELEDRTSAAEIGFVMQDPESQIVTDRVWHELVFGAENLGIPSDVIRRRAGELASYFGIDGWFRRTTDTLSGGQKQLLNLASVTLLQPKVLILDEPTAQLDPIAAAEFMNTLQRLNRQLGLTVILSEHRLEEVFPSADKILLMDKGKV
ncbi:MAG: ABC transporter ATP-binding protein, partial [Clostridia bacterium]|nr:ABC transporter ATP-binding protein [Clostridia bacterium]